jgi:glycosyltransferase involved in cell wall biosynthesis
LRLAVVSPFLDHKHGTERVVLEQLERFTADPDVEIHIYTQRLEDLAGAAPYQRTARANSPSRIYLHRIPALGGPHLLAYVWWFIANQLYRWADARFRGLTYDLVYSPGINCWDADAIAIHIVFRLKLRDSPLCSWPRSIHRRLYYRLIMLLERRIYTRPNAHLAAVSQLVARHITEFFGRSDVCVIPNAVDAAQFSPEIRLQRRASAREHLGLSADIFALLLVGNDWEKKGLGTLLRSMADCLELPFRLLVTGTDDRNSFLPLINRLGLQERVQFTASSGVVMQFYAAADVYAGPSLEDSFALPPLEAMACGLPVITSVNNGGSQIITEGADGFVLSDPRDSAALTRLLRRLYERPELRRRVGENAACTARQYSWDRNARETWDFLMSALRSKQQRRRLRSGLSEQ